MNSYTEMNAHHIGNTHIQKNLPCEDYSLSYSDNNLSFAVISDGHGDKNCFRSKDGARIACETSLSLCRSFYKKAENSMREFDEDVFAQLLPTLESQIVKVWKERVSQEYSQNPFTEEEIQTASEKMQDIYRSGQHIEKAYGCTLILAMVTEKYWFGMQIGDGKCVAAYDDGVFVEPIPKDEENCVANHSTSLCNSNAEELIRHYFSPILPTAVFVFSDGVEESFDISGLYSCLYSIDLWLKDGYETTVERLDELLPQISEGGSGDDVSLSAILSTEKTLSAPKKTQSEIEDRVNALAEYLDKCDSQLDTAYSELEEMRKALETAEDTVKKLKEQMEHQQIRIEDLSETQSKAYEQMKKAEKYQASAEAFWQKKLQLLNLSD